MKKNTINKYLLIRLKTAAGLLRGRPRISMALSEIYNILMSGEEFVLKIPKK